MAGNNIRYDVATTNFADGNYDFSVQWYSDAAGTTPRPGGAPAGVSRSPYGLVNDDTAVGINTTSSTPAGTYYFRVTIDGIQSSNVATLVVNTINPTSINFGATTTYYTYHGRVFGVPFTLSPSGADPSKITWTSSSDYHPIINAVVTSTTSSLAVVHTTASDNGSYAMAKRTVTLTATLPNNSTVSVTINTRFAMQRSFSSDMNTGSDFFNMGVSYSWNNSPTTRTMYVRAYYASNATEWAVAFNAVASLYLRIIGDQSYTITSNSTDVTVTRITNGYQLTRSSTGGLRTVNLTITVGSGASTQTYTQVLNLVD